MIRSNPWMVGFVVRCAFPAPCATGSWRSPRRAARSCLVRAGAMRTFGTFRLPDHRYPSSMAARFTYSRWDGTQKGFELDADGLFEELTDDLLYHGDVNSALRRLMQQGMKDRNGERVQGL